jgi:diguanylate cyclase (GGDEF)-like protein
MLPIGEGLITVFGKAQVGVVADRGANEQSERMRWVIGIRWTVVVALMLVGLLGIIWQGYNRETGYWHLGLAAFVALLNLLYLAVSAQPTLNLSAVGQWLRYAQIPLDLFVFTAIVHFSGGVTGPVFVLYFLYIFVGLAILPPAGAYFVAGTSAIMYAALALLEAIWMRPPASVADTHTAAATFGSYAGYVLCVSATLMIIAFIANYFAGMLTRNEGTIREQLVELNSLYSFTRTVSNSPSMDDLVNVLVAAARELEKASSAMLMLFNEQSEGTVVASSGLTLEQASRAATTRFGRDSVIVSTLLADGKGLFAPDVDAVPGLRNEMLRTGTRSFYSVPVWRDDRLVGALNLTFDRKYTMPGSQWNMLVAMTQQAALALERTRLLTDAQRAARESLSLYQIGLVTTSSLQIDEVLHLIFEQVNRLLHPDTFYIALYDEDQAELTYDIFVEGGQQLPPFKARLDTVGIASWVIRNRRPIFIHDWNAEHEQLPFESNLVGSPTQSLISVPLIAKDKIVGVMSAQAQQPGAFDQHSMRLLTSVASQAALALENARLHATVHEQAQRDSLTGAFNHGTFIDKLNRAIQAAREEHTTVALVMLDIDKFKKYNDTYGHLVGNDVLRTVVSSILSHIKGTDVVGRWGGEEFAIILPSVSRAQARGVTERIRQTVAHNVMRDMQNRPIPSPTVSQGIAVFPDDAVQLEELIAKADTALYRAKELGRNYIVEWIVLSDNGGDVH